MSFLFIKMLNVLYFPSMIIMINILAIYAPTHLLSYKLDLTLFNYQVKYIPVFII